MDNLSENEIRLVERRLAIESQLRELRDKAETLAEELDMVNAELKDILIPGSYLLDTDVDWSAMPNRIWQRLRGFQFEDGSAIETYRDLTSLSAEDIRYGTRGLAGTSMAIIESHLASLGLSLQPYRSKKRRKKENFTGEFSDGSE